MAKDIVKELLLRFKGDTKPLEQSIKKTEQVVQKLQKTVAGGGSGGSPIAQVSKTLDKYIKSQEKLGMTINKDMTKFQKTIQDVATKDLRILQQQTDNLFTRTQQRLQRLRQEEKRLQEMRTTGAAPEAISRQQRRVGRAGAVYSASEGRFISSAEDFAGGAGGGQQPPSMRERMGGFFRGAGAVATGVAAVAETVSRVREEREEARSILSETLKRRRMAAYSGDITEALLERRDKVLTRAGQYADTQTKTQDWKMGALGVAGALGLGAVIAGTGGLAGLAIGGAAAIGGATTALPYLLGGRDKYREQQRRAQVGRLTNQTMTPELYQFLQERAPLRYNYQRQLQMGDQTANAFQAGALNNNFTEQEAAGTALAFRGQFGNVAGTRLANQTMSLARKQGMSLDVATNLMGSTAFSGTGGDKSAQKTLTAMYTDAFSKGLTDSGLVEVLQKGVAQLAEQSPDVTDMAALAARIASSISTISTGREPGARDVAGAIQSQNILNQISQQGGEAGFARMSALNKVVGGNVQAMAFFNRRTDQQVEELFQNNDPVLKGLGLSPEQIAKGREQFTQGMTAAKTLGGTAIGKGNIQAIIQDLNEGKSLSQVLEEHRNVTENITGKAAGKEADMGALLQTLRAAATTNPALDKALKKGDIADQATNKLMTLTVNPKFSSLSDNSQFTLADIQERSAMQARTNAAMQGRPGAGSGTVSDAIITNQRKGEIDRNNDANKLVSEVGGAQGVAAAGRAMRASPAPTNDLGQSVTNLKAALDSFVKSIESNAGNAASSTSSGAR